MLEKEYLLKCLQMASGITVRMLEKDTAKERRDFDAALDDPSLYECLIQGAKSQDAPYIFRDEYDIFHASIVCGEDVYVVGPAALRRLSSVEVHRYYYGHGMRRGSEIIIPVVRLTTFLSAAELAAFLLKKEIWKDSELLERNPLKCSSEDNMNIERLPELSALSDDVQNLWIENTEEHFTYYDELQFLDAVQNGKADEAINRIMVLDRAFGYLSSDSFRQWVKMAAIGITLASRAAIRGGLPPADTYLFSDKYLRQIDSCTEPADLLSGTDFGNLRIYVFFFSELLYRRISQAKRTLTS